MVTRAVTGPYDGLHEVSDRSEVHQVSDMSEINILVLGRTGVGKSTWINAIINYLAHPSLDDALAADSLGWVVPFSFSVNFIPDDQDEYQCANVKVGFTDQAKDDSIKVDDEWKKVDECDGATGVSATQRTIIHCVKVRDRVIRFIDTPGIGDTRGPDHDKENMADILRTLRNYNDLHGILILLKPNEQRLDVMFRFCIQELLIHLHNDAAKNIAFGFTNTRGTNYAPGDTFDPLFKLLEKYKDVRVPLSKNTVYCFDSEGFRYLAVQKQFGVKLDYLVENQRSWDHSVKESSRLLQHFQSLTPHPVRSTTNLYEVRSQLQSIAEPIAITSRNIQDTIRENEEDINSLMKVEMDQEELEQRLKTEIRTSMMRGTGNLRTVCAHQECVQHLPRGILGRDGNPVLDVAHKRVCCYGCWIPFAKLDTKGKWSLKLCGAFKFSSICHHCNHEISDHMQIRYDLEEIVQCIDPELKASINEKVSIADRKRVAIETKKNLIQELGEELDMLQEAAVQFSVFLKQNALLTYNDATLEYLERTMKEERAKVSLGGSRDNLDSLIQYEKKYKQLLQTLQDHVDSGKKPMDAAGAEELMRRLYSLKHYGTHLEKMRETFDAVGCSGREKPYVVK
ncbi:putative Aaa ATPase domain protein [Gregarina niphandrodes]|uniref:Aaa ATPase domain protein n=1 Tax=Gregarina niphandrodes TaxID=110365 RepID=A0A023B561_GRENI|nr:putative Aaa ATPase domain protein [Gregarina niphandrodes]EZG58883.1 putative Aaa ATPase domain protein [Gregarina niphandrodes]|eukprot:XP_011130938.1 putative Aaa ATPase domain protein [Gregarina niphandrodes]